MSTIARKIESALRDRLQATVPAGSGNTWTADDDGITDADGYFRILPNGDGWTVVSSRPSLHMEAVAVDDDEAVRAVAAMDAARGAFNVAMKRSMVGQLARADR